jgi:3-phosphoshikimate 1-carboxyvinyltransferase
MCRRLQPALTCFISGLGTVAESRSQWSSLSGVASATLQPLAHPVRGTVALPGSKSFTNRALIVAACAAGTSVVSGILRSDDSWWCIESLRQLGAVIEEDGESLRITGPSAWAEPSKPLYIGSAGTTGRFLTSVLALSVKSPVTITASEQLSRRPMKTLFEALTTLGARFEFLGQPGCFPVRILPRGPGESVVAISGGQSSQFISGLLMAAPLMDRPVEIQVTDRIVQADYVRITLEVLAAFGIQIEANWAFVRFFVEPSTFRPADYAVEADASTATYFAALGALGGEVTISNLRLETTQPDIEFLEVLKRMGCEVTGGPAGVTVRGPARLRGGFSIDMRAFSDSFLTLAAIAPFSDGQIDITGVAHIRHHESDRINVMARILAILGVPAEERTDGIRIFPGKPRFGRVPTHDDHRVAMSLAVLGLAGSGIEITDPGCVSKTCPNFFDLISTLISGAGAVVL